MGQTTVEQKMNAAVGHHQAGQLPEAEALFNQILVQQPDHAHAMHRLGVINAQNGRMDAALNLFSRVISLRPEWADAFYDLGNALRLTGKPDRSVAAYQRAISLKPNWPEPYNNLGTALLDLGRPDEAISAFRQVISLKPNSAQGYGNLANAYKAKYQLDESIAAYRQALAIAPNLPELHNNLSVALKEIGRLDESIAACRRAISLRPAFAEAHNNLGVVLEETNQLDDAVASYNQAIELKPGYAQAHYNRGNALRAKGQLDESIAAYQRAMALSPNFVEAHNNFVYTLHFHPAYDASAIAGEHRRWNDRHGRPLKQFIQAHPNDRTADRRLRIGYVSPDFREHPVGRFLLPLLANHDKSGFEIFAYSQSPTDDAVTQRLRTHTDQWRNISRLSDAQAADLIRQDKIDILVDLTMHMAHNRLLVFARKPAPVQVTWLAYCSTTGLDTIDYRLSDPYLDPPGGDESIYTEQTIRLPETYWCYEPSVESLEISPLPVLKRGHITFGCLNSFTKVSPPALKVWTQILNSVPNSHLLLHAPEGGHRQQLLDQFNKDGIDPARIRFAGKSPLADYFRRYDEIDIALDTFPYGGGTTTCDALWMGVPTVSLVGETAVGRGGVSILSNIGLPELVADSREEYVRLAIELAGDLPRLSNLRRTLRHRMEQSPLMDAPRFASHIESAYRRMWRLWAETPYPEHSESK